MDSAIRRATQESLRGKVLPNTAADRILEKYECALRLPRRKPAQQLLLCPVGLVGAGKTTVLKALGRRLPFLRISNDEIRMRLIAEGYNLVRTRELALRCIEKYLRMGYSVAVDADCSGPDVYDSLKRLAKAAQFKAVWIHIKPPEAFILRNLQRRSRKVFRNPEEAIRVYRLRKPLHRYLKFPFIYRFDPSRRNLSSQIAEAVVRIRQTLVQ